MKTLSEEYFQEVLGFDTAGKTVQKLGNKVKRKTEFASPELRVKGFIKGVSNYKDNPNKGFFDNKSQQLNAGTKEATKGAQVGKNLEKIGDITNKYGDTAGRVGLGAAYAGGAYLLYKGIKALYNKYKEAKTPEAKIAIKSQINSKKAQLAKVKK